MATATKPKSSANGSHKTDDLAPLGVDVVRIVVPKIEVKTVKIRLVGLSPLITDNGESAVPAIERRQSAAPKEKHGVRDPESDFKRSTSLTKDGEYGMRRLAFKKAVVVAAGRFTEHFMTVVNGIVTIRGDEIIPLDVDAPTMRRDRVVPKKGSTDVRYRAEFWPWAVDLDVDFIHPDITIEQLIHLFRRAGRSVGIGNWRPEKSGDFGTWDVDDVQA